MISLLEIKYRKVDQGLCTLLYKSDKTPCLEIGCIVDAIASLAVASGFNNAAIIGILMEKLGVTLGDIEKFQHRLDEDDELYTLADDNQH